MDSNFTDCLEKQTELKQIFLELSTEERFQKVIDYGKSLAPYPEDKKEEPYLVKGCQSRTYLYSFLEEDRIRFLAESDALISAGLVSLLIHSYDKQPPLALVKCPPHFINEIGLLGSLSPNRAQGLLSMYQRMKEEALKFLITNNK